MITCHLPHVGAAIDGNNPDHIMWICEKGTERADEFGIQGVNYRLAQGSICVTMMCVHVHVHVRVCG